VRCFLGIYLSAASFSAPGQVLVRLAGDSSFVWFIGAVNGETWIGADEGAFRVDSSTKEAVRVRADTGPVYSV
jgi:hypothetical protein